MTVFNKFPRIHNSAFGNTLFCILILFSVPLHASGFFSQTGTISGRVIDSLTLQPLIGATVIDAHDPTIGAVTDVDGQFNIAGLRTGSYELIIRYVGYHEKSVKNVSVSADAVTNLEIRLSSETIQINTVTIRDTRKTNTENAVINEIKTSSNVVSGVSGTQIAKSQDRDAADVVRRVPGVTVIDNRFIMVRGLTDRYNNVWINDASTPSSETDKKSFSFDVIPSSLIDHILIYKTPSPDLPGDFAGGMVKIYTKAFPSNPGWSISFQSSYRSGTTFQPFNYTQGSSTDWLGFDNGFRSLPPNTSGYLSKYNEDAGTIDKTFHNTWGILDKNALPDFRLNIYYAGIYKLSNKLKMGNTFGIIYSNTYTNYNIHQLDWDSLAAVHDYNDVTTTNTVRSALLENVSLLCNHFTFEFKNFLNQTGTAQTVVRTSNLQTASDELFYYEDYEERTTYSSELIGKYLSEDKKTEYNATLGYNYSYRNEPDLKRVRYTKQQTDPDSLYKANVANVVDPVNGGGRFFSVLNENTWSFDHFFRKTIQIGNYSFDVNVGNYFEYKYRWFRARVLGYTIVPGALAFQLTHETVGEIFQSDNVGYPGGFYLDEITSPSDKYNAQNKLAATYLSFNLPVGKKIKILTGARYEYNEQALQSYVNLDSISPKVITRFLLPSFNITYNFNDKNLLRFAYGKTLNRPEFREWAPFYFYDFEYNAGTYGSLFPTILSNTGEVLKVAEINNVDLRYEWYPGIGEALSVGLFYKTFTNPIQRVILNTGGVDSKVFTYVNGESAYTRGIEVDVRKNLSFLAPNSSFFSDMTFVANTSLIQSQLTITKVINQITEIPLQGQSPYVINAGFYYQNDTAGIQASLLYNVFGPRIYLIGTLDYANIGELPEHSLDLTVSKNLGKVFSVNLSVQNMLDSPSRLYQDTNRDSKFETDGSDKLIQYYKRGRYYSAGVKLKF